MAVGKTAFVVMPFSSSATCTEEEWTEIYENIFYPAIEDTGYLCARSSPSTGSLAASIIEKLHASTIVLADLTDRNPNVFYELGIRHTLSKRTILTTRAGSKIPSDLGGYWYLSYGTRPKEVSEFKRSFQYLVRKIENDPERSDNPVSDYFAKSQRQATVLGQKEALKKINALCTEMTGNLLALEDQRAALLSTDCLRLLIKTLYIDPGQEILKQIYELVTDLRRIETDPAYLVEHRKNIRNKGRHLLKSIGHLQQELALGTYNEPAEPSYMVWRAVDLRVGQYLGPWCIDGTEEPIDTGAAPPNSADRADD
jgi:hypothetical protein